MTLEVGSEDDRREINVDALYLRHLRANAVVELSSEPTLRLSLT